MFRMKTMKRRGYAAALLATGIAVAAALVGCWDEPTEPVRDGEPVILRPGLNVYLTLDRADAKPGETVRVTARAQPVDVDLTPTGFQVDLQYDPDRLEPVAATRFGDGVLRAVNLSAEPGLIRAAGAVANGLGSRPLFGLDMEIKAPDWGETLTLDVRELTVLQDNFADASAAVVPAARAAIGGH